MQLNSVKIIAIDVYGGSAMVFLRMTHIGAAKLVCSWIDIVRYHFSRKNE